MTAGFCVVTNALAKVLGGQMLNDVQTFVAALDTLFGASGNVPRRPSHCSRPTARRSS